MSNKINCQNQQPAYSGITINITNPAINPPSQNNYYCTYPAETSQIPTRPGMIYAEQYPQLQQGQTEAIPQTYINRGEYLEPIDSRYESTAAEKTRETYETVKDPAQSIYNDSRTTNQYITQTPNQNQESGNGNAKGEENEAAKTGVSGYPAEYYMNKYETRPEAQTSNAIRPDESNSSNNGIIAGQENDTTEENVGKEIIRDLDERAEKEKELEANGKKTKIVALTNEYIMSLENYLNNPNKDIRLMASKEIINRFNEDRSRYDDAALNALINKMLQDPEKLIRIAAFSALSSELASGNDYTVQLLNQVQQNPEADPNDVLEASEILLKRASMTEVRYVRSNGQEQKSVTKAGKETEEVQN